MKNHLILLLFSGLFLAFFAASSAADNPVQTIVVGYLEYAKDERYTSRRLEARYRLQPWGRPFAGAELGVKDSRFPLMSRQVALQLAKRTERSVEDLLLQINKLYEEDVHFFLVDFPDDILHEVAQKTRDKSLLLFNISALGVALRQEGCQAHLFHVAPSWDMLTDALAQYLVTRQWRDILVLAGESEADQALNTIFLDSAKRFGLKVVETRPFQLSRDPRHRHQNNVALLTGKAKYDVVFVADTHGEFARYVPYQTLLPRPVVGSNGLVPEWWFWSWDRHGAPQVNGRFQKQAGRLMTGYDWSAWMAIKVVTEAIIRSHSLNFNDLSAYIRSNDLVLDGTKGTPQNFRQWNNQLRQPLFVASGDAVVERLPLDGFLHPTNQLDTLGIDETRNRCQF
ncbi:ABC transporter substrate-binding protein [Thioflexithrix psekupsensis]|uniref:Leucine-binding protein domain-containing protein n=1 Tax=Thioflexithrix psekupsensis TaxID=1570016 RepID=A0A251X7L6_9GAMM|nr:ABC transporter substrate-binding protein [Thioflexithrix psekupsensis]OUD13545.1 hypothetical protein TPSD3_10155 [Thioflexithrix psekupsensis]